MLTPQIVNVKKGNERSLRLTPPFRRQALGPAHPGDPVQRAPPAKQHRRVVGQGCYRLDRLGPRQQAQGPGRRIEVMFALRYSAPCQATQGV
jgi:hypothetical protein